MKKPAEVKPSVWDDLETPAPKESAPQATDTPKAPKAATPVQAQLPALAAKPVATGLEFDLDGLQTDFPTATELQKFVYDQTGVTLNLKGRSNKVKYQIALDVLNGIIPPQEVLGSENPYLDKNDLIPTEPLRDVPARDPEIEHAGPEVTRFTTNSFPHPDPEWKANDQKCQVTFRKYVNGIISYEILGPISQRAIGTKVNKYGREVPERIVWIDCRTGEQVIRRANGSLTPLGTKLKSFMTRQRVNKGNQWDTWIDRDFVVGDSLINDNPWSV
jgi:hypothetical protein